MLQARGIVDDARPWLGMLEPVTPPPTMAPHLLHGDLYARHILLDRGGKVCGIIDWGDVHAGEPAIDLAVAFGFLPSSARRSFVESYGAIDDVTSARARVRAVLHSVSVAR